MMFPKPIPSQLALSEHFSTQLLAVGQVARWTARRLKRRRACEECSWLMHETRGRGLDMVRDVKQRRTLPNGRYIDMCTSHAALWKMKDLEEKKL